MICLGLMSVCLLGKARLEKKMATHGYHPPTIARDQANLELQSIKRFNLGFPSLVSGLLWVQLLQEAKLKSVNQGEVSWEFTRLNAITSLDPNMDVAFSFGAVFLSVFKRDRLGARIILEKWVRQRPNFWRAEYLLGYHLYYEMGLFKEGSEHLLRAASFEHSPGWLTSLGIRLLSATGALAQALRMTCDLYGAVHSVEGQLRLRKRVRSLNYALQKAGWEEALNNYHKQFHREPATIQELHSTLLAGVRDLSSIMPADVDPELKPLIHEGFKFIYDPKKHSIECAQKLEDIEIDITGVHIPQGGT